MQPVGGIDEFAVARNHDFRREVRADEILGQGRNGLLSRQRSARGVVAEERKRGRLFLKRIEPASIGMKGEVPRSISRRQRYECGTVRRERPRRPVKKPAV